MTGKALSGAWPAPVPAALDLRVEGPDVRGLSDADIRRLFPGRLTGERLNRLRNWPRVVVRVDEVPVGVATYTQTPVETHVPDFAIEVPASLEYEHGELAPHVVDSLLDAIEIRVSCRRVPPHRADSRRRTQPTHAPRIHLGQRGMRRLMDGKVAVVMHDV